MRPFNIWLLGWLLIGHQVLAQSFEPVRQPLVVQDFLRQSAHKTESIQAKFREEKKLKVLKGTQKSSGSFYFKKDDQMRWEQKVPSQYTILIDGAVVRVSDGAKEKSMEGGRMAQQIRSLILGLVNGDFTDDKGFEKNYLENTQAYQVRLYPKNKRLKSIYQEIGLIFNKKNGILERLTFIEKSGDRREMVFYDQIINKPISQSLFSAF